MPKFKRIIISYFSGEPRELMRKAGFTWKFTRPVPIADSVEFYCCERKKKGRYLTTFVVSDGVMREHFHTSQKSRLRHVSSGQQHRSRR